MTESYACIKCEKPVLLEEVWPWRSLSADGSTVYDPYCEPCGNALYERIYGSSADTVQSNELPNESLVDESYDSSDLDPEVYAWLGS